MWVGVFLRIRKGISTLGREQARRRRKTGKAGGEAPNPKTSMPAQHRDSVQHPDMLELMWRAG